MADCWQQSEYYVPWVTQLRVFNSRNEVKQQYLSVDSPDQGYWQSIIATKLERRVLETTSNILSVEEQDMVRQYKSLHCQEHFEAEEELYNQSLSDCQCVYRKRVGKISHLCWGLSEKPASKFQEGLQYGGVLPEAGQDDPRV